MQHRQKDQAALVMSLLQEETWQYQAFSSLLSQRDRRTNQLSEDIRTVVDKLNQLTSWELQRKSRQLDITNVSWKKAKTLSPPNFVYISLSSQTKSERALGESSSVG